jgi:hypothetical protein
MYCVHRGSVLQCYILHKIACCLYILHQIAYRIIVCCTTVHFTRLHTVYAAKSVTNSVLHFYILHKIPLYAMPFTRLHIGSVLDFYSILYTSQACLCCNVFHQIAYRIINVQHFYILHKIAYFTCTVMSFTIL